MSTKQAVGPRIRRPSRTPGKKAPPVEAAAETGHPERSPWRLVRGGAALHRVYEFPNTAAASSFSQFAISVASHTRLPLFVSLAGLRVTLALRGMGSRRLGPLTSKLFDQVATLS
jgi:hypothetical protein